MLIITLSSAALPFIGCKWFYVDKNKDATDNPVPCSSFIDSL